MSAAIDDCRKLYTRVLATHIQSAATLGSVKLVCGQGGQIDVHLIYIERHFTQRLYCVGMEQHATLTAKLANLFQGLQNTDLIVGRHNADQNGLVGECSFELVQINQSIRLYGKVGHLIAVFFQALAGIEHRLVLGHRGNDVVPFFPVHLGYAFDCEVVALGGSRGKDDLLGGRADELGNLFARGFHGCFCFPPELVVTAGGIAEHVGEIRRHGLQHPWIKGCGGVIVHINWQLNAVGGMAVASVAAHLFLIS